MKILRFIDQTLEIPEDFGDFLESRATSEIKKTAGWLGEPPSAQADQPIKSIAIWVILFPGKVVTEGEDW
jgi:hypothetical protein